MIDNWRLRFKTFNLSTYNEVKWLSRQLSWIYVKDEWRAQDNDHRNAIEFHVTRKKDKHAVIKAAHNVWAIYEELAGITRQLVKMQR